MAAQILHPWTGQEAPGRRRFGPRRQIRRNPRFSTSLPHSHFSPLDKAQQPRRRNVHDQRGHAAGVEQARGILRIARDDRPIGG